MMQVQRLKLIVAVLFVAASIFYYWYDNVREVSLNEIVAAVDKAQSLYQKETAARERFRRFHAYADLIELSKEPILTESQKFVLVEAYMRRQDAVTSRVVQIAKEDTVVGHFADEIVRERNYEAALATQPSKKGA